MATLEGAIEELVIIVGNVTGINRAPDTPTEQVSTYPVAMIYASDGNLAEIRTSSADKSLHNIQIVVLMPYITYRQCFKTMLPLYEPIVAALITDLNARKSKKNVAHWGLLSYTLGPIEWDTAGQLSKFGYIFTLTGVKIENTV